MPDDASTRIARIERALASALAPESLEVVDESEAHRGHAGAAAGGGHYRVSIVSSSFAGCSRLQRHRKVYDALRDEMGADIHALALTTLTPDEVSR